MAKYTINDVSFEITKLPNHKHPSLVIGFKGEKAEYNVASFKNDATAKWVAEMIDLLIEEAKDGV